LLPANSASTFTTCARRWRKPGSPTATIRNNLFPLPALAGRGPG
jgi:hypothetical protein